MNAGKSTYLLQAAHLRIESGIKVALFTAAVDDRTKVGQITSRLGISREAMTFDKDTDFFEVIKSMSDVSCVLVDEAQFATGAQARQLHRAAVLLGVQITCFMLRTDFRGVPFEGSAALLSYAEDIQEIGAICRCENKSTMNIRIDDQGQRVRDGEQLLIGGNNRYRQVCARCFYA